MIGIFKQKTPANILILLVFGVLIKLPMFQNQYVPIPGSGDGPLFKGLVQWLQSFISSFPSIFSVSAFALLFLQALMLTHLINKRRLVNVSTYLPGMSYLLITSLFPEWNYFSSALFVNTALIFVLSVLMSTYNVQKAGGMIFNIGLILGIANFFFTSSFAFIVWILIALAIMRPFRINEWLLCLLGITTPYYFYGFYLFLTDQWSWNHFIPLFQIKAPELKQTVWEAGSVFLVAVPFLAGGYHVQDNLRRMLVQVRKGWSLVLLFLLTAIFIPFLDANSNFENWIVAAVPFASFHASAYLYSKSKWIPLILFWFTIAFILTYQYYGPRW